MGRRKGGRGGDDGSKDRFLSLKRAYEDKYIAIVDDEVVFSGEDPEVVFFTAKRKFPEKEVILWKVPHGDSFIF